MHSKIDAKKLQLVKELHKPARRNYQRRHLDTRGIDETWQGHLVEMQPYERVNKGYKNIRTVINTFSTFSWAVPVKSKKGEDVVAAMESVLYEGRVAKNLHIDRGKELYNSQFEYLMKRYKKNLYSTVINGKASICEPFNRTLMNKM
ncbi:uncharacterized protein LOC117180438 [Belonocnema kinseyi]|uniref:uncharacterized protein LOC117180438 n=1 Tax=Belonocnema kinseyi TaxID=2817044 RepID=UPI00143DA8EF|nr:uncharacterized protein LOC117180438 [Belonocnema kinseyi]